MALLQIRVLDDIYSSNEKDACKHPVCSPANSPCISSDSTIDSSILDETEEDFVSYLKSAIDEISKSEISADQTQKLFNYIFLNMLRRKNLSSLAISKFKGSFFDTKNVFVFMKHLLHVIQCIYTRFLSVDLTHLCFSTKSSKFFFDKWVSTVKETITEYIQVSNTCIDETQTDIIAENINKQSVCLIMATHIVNTFMCLLGPTLSGVEPPSLDRKIEHVDPVNYIEHVDPHGTKCNFFRSKHMYDPMNIVEKENIGNVKPEILYEGCRTVFKGKLTSFDDTKPLSTTCMVDIITDILTMSVEDCAFTDTFSLSCPQTSSLNVSKFVYNCDFKNVSIDQNQFIHDSKILDEFSTLLTSLSEEQFCSFAEKIQTFLSQPLVVKFLQESKEKFLFGDGIISNERLIYSDIQSLPFFVLNPLFEIFALVVECVNVTPSVNTTSNYTYTIPSVTYVPQHIPNEPVSITSTVLPVEPIPENTSPNVCCYACGSYITKDPIPPFVEDAHIKPEEPVVYERGYSHFDMHSLFSLTLNKLFLHHQPIIVFKTLMSVYESKCQNYKRLHKWCNHCELPGHCESTCFFIRSCEWNTTHTSYQQEITISKAQQNEDKETRNKRQRRLNESDESGDTSTMDTSNSIVSFITEILKEVANRLKNLVSEDISPEKNAAYAEALVGVFNVKHFFQHVETQQRTAQTKNVFVLQPFLPLSCTLGLYQKFEDLFWQNGKNDVNETKPAFVMQRYSKNPLMDKIVHDLFYQKSRSEHPGHSIILKATMERNKMLNEEFILLENKYDHDTYYSSTSVLSQISSLNNCKSLLDDVRLPVRIIKDIIDHILLCVLIENHRYAASSLLHKNNILAQKIFFTHVQSTDTEQNSSCSNTKIMAEPYSPSKIRQIFANYDVGSIMPYEIFSEQVENVRELSDFSLPEIKNVGISQDFTDHPIFMRNKFINTFIIFDKSDKNYAKLALQDDMDVDTDDKNTKTRHVDLDQNSDSFVKDMIDSNDCFMFDFRDYYKSNKKKNEERTVLMEQIQDSTNEDFVQLQKMMKNFRNKYHHFATNIVHFLNSNYHCWGTRKKQLEFERYVYSLLLFVTYACKYSSYSHIIDYSSQFYIRINNHPKKLYSTQSSPIYTKTQKSENRKDDDNDDDDDDEVKLKKQRSNFNKSSTKATEKENQTKNPKKRKIAEVINHTEIASSKSIQNEEQEKMLEKHLPSKKKAKVEKPTQPTVQLAEFQKICDLNTTMLKMMIAIMNEIHGVKGLLSIPRTPIEIPSSRNNFILIPKPQYVPDKSSLSTTPSKQV